LLSGIGKPRPEAQVRADEALRRRLEEQDELLRLNLAAARAAVHPPPEKPRRGRPPGQPKTGDVKKALKLLQEAVTRELEGLPPLPAHSTRAIAESSGVPRYWVTKYRNLMRARATGVAVNSAGILGHP